MTKVKETIFIKEKVKETMIDCPCINIYKPVILTLYLFIFFWCDCPCINICKPVVLTLYFYASLWLFLFLSAVSPVRLTSENSHFTVKAPSLS